MNLDNYEQRRKRLFDIIEVGNDSDRISRGYDFLNTILIIANLAVSILYTFDTIRSQYGTILIFLERLTVITFFIDYVLRIFTARYLYKNQLPESKAILRYALSFTGIVDLLSFLPYYLPFFFPAGAIAFRMFRIVRIFRLFRITAYYDSLNIITDVIKSKRQQLLSSVFIILVLMIAASLCMYSLEHNAQPDVFTNAFSGIWWSVSTILTVGYGDIYPVTVLGQFFSIIIAFLGVGMVAIPTGIISAGFVEQYTKVQTLKSYESEKDIDFMRLKLTADDKWVGKNLTDLQLPGKIIATAVIRDNQILLPNSKFTLKPEDILILGSEPVNRHEIITMKKVILLPSNPWVGCRIRELDLSRQSLILTIIRNNKTISPKGSTMLESEDIILLYTKKYIPDSEELTL